MGGGLVCNESLINDGNRRKTGYEKENKKWRKKKEDKKMGQEKEKGL